MAHVALVNSENVVEDIHVIDNADLPNNGDFSQETEAAAQNLQDRLGLSFSGKCWLLTSYNNNFRGKFACIGDTYREDDDLFISQTAPESNIVP